MRFRSVVPIAAIAAATLWAQLVVVGQETKDDAVDSARLVEVLLIQPGSAVADIGAGSGGLAERMAQAVGREGRIYATEVNPQRLDDLRSLAHDPSVCHRPRVAARPRRPDLTGAGSFALS